MKLKKEIEHLCERAKTVTFPAPPVGFTHFRDNLRAIICENCGSTIASTLEYNSYTEMFYVVVQRAGFPSSASNRHGDDSFNLKLEKVISINPRGNITASIDEINKAQQDLNSTHNLLSAMLESQREGLRMIRPDESENS